MSNQGDDGDSERRLPRRRVLQGIGGAIGAAAIGCGGADGTSDPKNAGSASAGSGGAGGDGSGGDGGRGGDGSGGDGGGEGGGDACTGGSDLSASELLAPIDTIVVLCLENRSFDHYLGALSLLEGRAVDGLKGGEFNLDPNGKKVPIFKFTNFEPEDPPHSWDEVHGQWNEGKNDGFVLEHAGPHQQDVMGYHTRDQLPVHYALADEFVVCDNWFCSVLGPTWPNRFYLHGATAKGKKGNTPNTGFESIFDVLGAAGVSHRNYYADLAWASGGYFKFGGLSGIETFFDEAQKGTLPQYSLIDPQFFGAGANDDHPPHHIALGQALIGSVYSALAKSPHWDRCLLVVTYDEHGGFYDHVPPPKCFDDHPDFRQLGFRVPSLVAGPHVRRGCTVSTAFEHVSVISTLTKRYGLKTLNGRVDATNDLSSCIDPKLLKAPRPPIQLPTIDVKASWLEGHDPSRDRHLQPELWDAAESGVIPRHLDRRGQSSEIARRVLEHGERLGAVRIRG